MLNSLESMRFQSFLAFPCFPLAFFRIPGCQSQGICGLRCSINILRDSAKRKSRSPWFHVKNMSHQTKGWHELRWRQHSHIHAHYSIYIYNCFQLKILVESEEFQMSHGPHVPRSTSFTTGAKVWEPAQVLISCGCGVSMAHLPRHLPQECLQCTSRTPDRWVEGEGCCRCWCWVRWCRTYSYMSCTSLHRLPCLLKTLT